MTVAGVLVHGVCMMVFNFACNFNRLDCRSRFSIRIYTTSRRRITRVFWTAQGVGRMVYNRGCIPFSSIFAQTRAGEMPTKPHKRDGNAWRVQKNTRRGYEQAKWLRQSFHWRRFREAYDRETCLCLWRTYIRRYYMCVCVWRSTSTVQTKWNFRSPFVIVFNFRLKFHKTGQPLISSPYKSLNSLLTR